MPNSTHCAHAMTEQEYAALRAMRVVTQTPEEARALEALWNGTAV